MDIELDFHYGISCVPYRCQNARSAWAAASTRVTVREVDPELAPVAMLVGNPESMKGDRHAGRYCVKEDGSPRAVRLFEGRHYVEAGPAASLAEDCVGEKLAGTFFGRASPRSSGVDRPGYGGRQVLTTIESFVREQQRHHPGPVVSANDDKGASMAAKLARLAEMMIIVGDTVFEYTPEPVMHLTNAFGDKAQIMPRPPSRFRAGTAYFHDNFSLHGFEFGNTVRSALAHVGAARKLARGRTLPFHEVIIPSASAFDGATHDVSIGAEELSRTMSGKASSMPWPQLEAFYVLRDAVADAGARVTPRLVRALEAVAGMEDSRIAGQTASAAALSAASRHWPGHYTGTKGIAEDRAAYDASSDASSYRERAGALLARWAAKQDGAYWDNGAGAVSLAGHGHGVSTFELLSAGTVGDAAAACRADPGPALAAAREGHAVVAVQAGGIVALGAVRQDGSSYMLAGNASYAPHVAAHRASCASAEAEELPDLSIGGDFNP